MHQKRKILIYLAMEGSILLAIAPNMIGAQFFELILDFNVSHIRIAGTSAQMELDGLKQVLEGFVGHGLPITSLTTDISKSVVTCVRG